MGYKEIFRRLLLLLALITLPVAAEAQPTPGAPPAVGVVRAAQQQITQTNEFIGRIQAVGRVALVARVTAFLEKRAFVEGTEVKKGDLLYLLEQPPFQAQVDFNQANVAQLQAQHRDAELTLERAQYLLKTVAGQQSNVDAALASERSLAAQIAAAQAQLQVAQINLDYTEIRAPIDGRISATAVTEGNVVTPTSGTLATLVSQDPMYVIFPIALRTGLELRDRYAPKGGFRAVKIRLRLPTGKIYDQLGHLDYVSPTVAENTDTITLRGVIPNPLLPGMKAGGSGLRQLTDGEFVTVLLEGVEGRSSEPFRRARRRRARHRGAAHVSLGDSARHRRFGRRNDPHPARPGSDGAGLLRFLGLRAQARLALAARLARDLGLGRRIDRVSPCRLIVRRPDRGDLLHHGRHSWSRDRCHARRPAGTASRLVRPPGRLQ